MKRSDATRGMPGAGALSAYFLAIRKTAPLTRPEEKALAARIRLGDNLALNALVAANLKFVVKVCAGYRDRGVPLEDLINEGNLGLMKAARRFDGERNLKFISYAVWWIRQSIHSALAGQGRPQPLPATKVAMLRRIAIATRVLEQRLNRVPDADEIAAETGIGLAAIEACRLAAAPPLRLDVPGLPTGDRAFVETLVDEKCIASDAVAQTYLAGKRLNEALGMLGPRASEILRQYYGLGRDTSRTLDEIRPGFGLSRERLRQILNASLQKLRRQSRLAGKS